MRRTTSIRPAGYSETLLDGVMPRYDLNEVHQIWVPVPPDVAFQAVKEVTPRGVLLFGPLMAIRTVFRRFSQDRVEYSPTTPILDELLRNGFLMLDQRQNSELLLGTIGRFWALMGGRGPDSVQSYDDFLVFNEPGYCKAALNFMVGAEGSGSRITTETRVVSTSPDAKKRFGRYWFVVKFGSAAIRRSWVHAINRRATRSASTTIRT